MPAARPPRPLPAHASDAWMYAGIMLIFGSLGPMIALLHDPPGGWGYALCLYVFAGLLAVGWSFMFQRRGLWFLLLIPLIVVPTVGMPIVMPRIVGWPVFRLGEGQSDLTRRIILIVMAMGGIAVGFTLIVRYLMRVERSGARAKAELALAAQIHASLVPSIDLTWGRLRIRGSSEPSGEMGGDLIDAMVADDRLDLFLADVSGHGVRAGVVMGMLKATLRTALRSGGDIRGHLSTLNRVLGELIEPSMFATAVWVRFERAESAGHTPGKAPIRATIVVAGHPPVFHFAARDKAWAEIDGTSLPLGILPGEEFQAREVPMYPGDTLALYTDGLTEAADPTGRQLGVAGVRDIIAGAVGTGASPEAVRESILASVRADRRSEDDQTLVLVSVS